MAKKKPAKGQRQSELERKRDDRSAKRALKKERNSEDYLDKTDGDFISFSNQLQAIGLKVKDVPGDGNCLFRALADQLDGDMASHALHRRETAQFMIDHRVDFEPFVEDDVPFDKHVKNLAKDGTFGGNDSIVAFSRNHKVDVVIHQHNAPALHIHGGSDASAAGAIRILNVSYHYGEHYGSVRRISEPATASQPGLQTLASGSASQDKRKDKPRKPRHTASTKQLSSGDGKAAEAVASADAMRSLVQDLVGPLIAATGCMDEELLKEALIECDYDLDTAAEYLMQLVEAKNMSLLATQLESSALDVSTSACQASEMKSAALASSAIADGSTTSSASSASPVVQSVANTAGSTTSSASSASSASPLAQPVANTATGEPACPAQRSPASNICPESNGASGRSDEGLNSLASSPNSADGCPHGPNAACSCVATRTPSPAAASVDTTGRGNDATAAAPVDTTGRGSDATAAAAAVDTTGHGSDATAAADPSPQEAAIALQIEEILKTCAAQVPGGSKSSWMQQGRSLDLSGLGLTATTTGVATSAAAAAAAAAASADPRSTGAGEQGTTSPSSVTVKVTKHSGVRVKKADKKKERKQRRADVRKQEAQNLAKLPASGQHQQQPGLEPGYVAQLADRPDGVPKIVSI